MSDVGIEILGKLEKDIKEAAKQLSPNEARYMVDAYYGMQEFRKASGNQALALKKSGEPNQSVIWLGQQFDALEQAVKKVLARYSEASPLGQWAESITGIGPVISAGLMAYIDITKCPTVGHIWAFAGLDPTKSWNKGEKRPWNASLKTLCWKIGESFVKVSGHEKDIYGKVYLERKGFEAKNNSLGFYSDQAKAKLEKFKIGKTTEAFGHYSGGYLPPAHIHARAKRYAVKLFLSAWHEASYFEHFKQMPPKPYVLEHVGGHAHYIPPPNTHLIEGWDEARATAKI